VGCEHFAKYIAADRCANGLVTLYFRAISVSLQPGTTRVFKSTGDYYADPTTLPMIDHRNDVPAAVSDGPSGPAQWQECPDEAFRLGSTMPRGRQMQW
jgi:hypothetical protein